MFFYNTQFNSIDRLENSNNNLNSQINYFGMFFINTKKYFIVTSCGLLILSCYWKGFIIFFFLNFFKWRYTLRSEKLRVNWLKKNEIIKEEFTNEWWWNRAELNIQDTYGYLIKDFDNLVNYSNLLIYYDIIDNFLFNKIQIRILNNLKFDIKKNFKLVDYKLKDLDIFFIQNINNKKVIFKKSNLVNYIMINHNIINLLSSKQILFNKTIIFTNCMHSSKKNYWWNTLNS